ncbi:Uncharacterised protein [Streptococcus criceti]|uniref:WD40 repeat domain-containing protein n=1 Tax=Streptococcus criceti HS-6 TaxID=873449 RepID=G5JSY7_STRCG|nr:hypothetical protein [Streptococcus criceti]EHI74976.1 hypothetical protein STRCR_2258 [Streptococcus criceti HS-6]SUN43507.1 Uncharacterised protein [Streptococcus criceti]
MEVKKILSEPLQSSYSVTRLQHQDDDYLLVASEVEDACFAYDLNRSFERTVIWDEIGGTMSIIQIPGTLDFLATQKFYPGFNAKSCQIVRGSFSEGCWTISKLADFPYLHRFDLIEQSDGSLLFVGCTIANSKSFVEDWSDKGKIIVGQFDEQNNQLTDLRTLPLRLCKNHGYYSVKEEGYSLITGVEGIIKLTYPEYSDTNDWRLDLLFGEETSDIVQIDLDSNGVKENVIIQAFHGDKLRVLNNDFTTEIFHHPQKTPFGHSIWSGYFDGQPVFIFGWRSDQADLMLYRKVDDKIQMELIDSGASSSNCLAFEKNGKNYIFSANNGRHEVALYQISF